MIEFEKNLISQFLVFLIQGNRSALIVSKEAKFGVVVNNGIILVDRINRLRRQGVERTEAIFSAGNDRLRPILITAGTTLLGLSPMIAPVLFPGTFGPIEGRASLWAPIAMALVGGLTTSTFMTLVVMPTIYSLFDDLTAFLGKVLRFARRTSTSVGAHLEGGEGSYAD